MAITCGSRLATSLLQDKASSLAGRTDVWRVSSPSLSQLRQGSGGLRTGRLPALSVTEENRSLFPLNLTCHTRGSKVQHVNAVVDALNPKPGISAGFHLGGSITASSKIVDVAVGGYLASGEEVIGSKCKSGVCGRSWRTFCNYPGVYRTQRYGWIR